MRKRWTLAALAFLAIVLCLLLIAPLATVEVKVDLPSATTVSSQDVIDHTATWIVSAVAIVFALVVLGVLAWVARHILRHPRDPGA